MFNMSVAKLALLLTASLLLTVPTAFADEVAQPSCAELRGRIGAAPQADPVLLRALAMRKECGFTSAEVYQAAYGDRPLPPQEDRKEWLRQYHHLDGHHIERD
jgi:hypothetical protein